jgi:hypothetical protein
LTQIPRSTPRVTASKLVPGVNVPRFTASERRPALPPRAIRDPVSPPSAMTLSGF